MEIKTTTSSQSKNTRSARVHADISPTPTAFFLEVRASQSIRVTVSAQQRDAQPWTEPTLYAASDRQAPSVQLAGLERHDWEKLRAACDAAWLAYASEFTSEPRSRRNDDALREAVAALAACDHPPEHKKPILLGERREEGTRCQLCGFIDVEGESVFLIANLLEEWDEQTVELPDEGGDEG